MYQTKLPPREALYEIKTTSQHRRHPRAIDVTDPSMEIRFKQANDAFHSGSFERALQIFNSLLEEMPSEPRIWHCKGNLLDVMGNLEDAVRCYDTALNYDPCDAETWYNKGTTLKKLGRDVESTTCIDHGLKLALGH